MLWYQGETDQYHPEVYDSMLRGVIHSWRTLFGQQFPVHGTQLASFGWWLGFPGTGYEVVRACQEKAADEAEKTYLVSLMDAGMLWDVHPKDKKIPGERMAKSVLKESYGFLGDFGSPRPDYEHITRRHGVVEIPFTDAQEGLLKTKGAFIGNEMEVLIDREPIRVFCGTVSGRCIRIESPLFISNQQIEIRYACQMYANVDIFNHEGFSIRPFIVKC